MTRAASFQRLPLALSLALLVAGCAHRLTGANHGADGPPWIAERASSPAAALDVDYRLLLIGDGGYYLEDDQTLAALGRWASGVESSSVVFLGDNIYNEGLVDDDRDRGEQILAQQLASTDRRKIVIPGNHDWGLLPRNQNARAIANQQAYVDGWQAGQAEFIPKDGCMGPVARVLLPAAEGRQAVVLIALDPTPWINERLREACPTPERDEDVLARLDVQLAEYADDLVIVVSHYPMLTGGPHGGLSYGFLADMIVTPLGWMMGGLMNTYEAEYADWIERTQAVFRKHPPAIYAAGHDHNLQLLDAEGAAGVYVVSGAGARERVSTVTDIEQTIFAHAAPGFVVVDIGLRDGSEADGRLAVVLRVVEANTPEPVFEWTLR